MKNVNKNKMIAIFKSIQNVRPYEHKSLYIISSRRRTEVHNKQKTKIYQKLENKKYKNELCIINGTKQK